MKMDMTQNTVLLGGLSMTVTSEMNILMSGKNDFEMSSKAKRVQVSILQGGKEMKYDSDSKKENLSLDEQQLKSQFDAILKTVAYHKLNKQEKFISMRLEPSIPNNSANNEDLIGYTSFPDAAVNLGSSLGAKVKC